MSEPRDTSGPSTPGAGESNEPPRQTGRRAAVPLPEAEDGYEPALGYAPRSRPEDGSAPRTGRRAAVPLPETENGYEPALGYSPAQQKRALSTDNDPAGDPEDLEPPRTTGRRAAVPGPAQQGFEPSLGRVPSAVERGWAAKSTQQSKKDSDTATPPPSSAVSDPDDRPRGFQPRGASTVQVSGSPAARPKGSRWSSPMAIAIYIVASVALLALVIWGLFALNSGGASADGEKISTLKAAKGQCFKDYSADSNAYLSVVDCTKDHSAQLVNDFFYPENTPFPGKDAFTEKGRELCQNSQLADGISTDGLKQRYAFPSESSWKQGDRRVDCIMFVEDGNTLNRSLIK